MHCSQTIVITGVTRGLGRALTEKFADLGHVVAGCGRDENRLSELRDKPGSPHSFQSVDVLNGPAVGNWAKFVLKQYGTPDFLINNAAIINKNNSLWKVPEEEFSKVIDSGLKGTANVLRAFLPAMINVGRGIIINFSSGAGRIGFPQIAPYCAAKWGIEGLTKALAQELPRGMAVIPLSPGPVNTEMLQSTMGEKTATNYHSPKEWVERAAPFILNLTPADTGKSLSVY